MACRFPFSDIMDGVEGDFIHSGPTNDQRDTSTTISELCSRLGNGYRFRYFSFAWPWLNLWRYPLGAGLTCWEANTSTDGVGERSSIIVCEHKIAEGFIATITWMAASLDRHLGEVAFDRAFDIKAESTEGLEVVKDSIDESGLITIDDDEVESPEELRLTTGKLLTGRAKNVTFSECDAWLTAYHPELSLIGSQNTPKILQAVEVDRILNYRIPRASDVEASSSSSVPEIPQPTAAEDESTQDATFSVPEDEEQLHAVPHEEAVPPPAVRIELPKKMKKTGRLPSHELKSLTIENSKFKPKSRRRQKRIFYF